jgi:hypothetical protein
MMDLATARDRLKQVVADGLILGYNRAFQELSEEQPYAVALFAASGFHGLGVAVNTRSALRETRDAPSGLAPDLLEMLQDHPDLLAMAGNAPGPDPEVWASEWQQIYSDLPAEEAGDLIRDLYDCFYEQGREPAEISEWFLDAISAGIRRFREALPDDVDLLQGLQFSDPGMDEIEMIERVSEEVNSPSWHARVQKACDDLRKASS